MRLCSYVVVHDSGLAPNPFWGYCTLAVCTPNHLGVRAEPGDWFVGVTTASTGHRLLYAMCVSEILGFDEYHHDPRFEAKKPVVQGSWRQRCGDNMYYKDDNGEWRQCRTLYHRDRSVQEQDLRNPRVLIGEHFYYFGAEAVKIPPDCSDIIWQRQGCKCHHDIGKVKRLLVWLNIGFAPGIHGLPRDNTEAPRCSC